MAFVNCNIESCFNTALQLVKSAGNVFMEGFRKSLNVIYKHNLYADLVTEYDKKIEEILITQLTKTYSNHKFIAEESTHTAAKLTEDPTWMIDPIDGTTNFVHKNPNCCISVSFAVNKKLQFGIVYSPVQNKMFTAQEGKGAYLNGKAIHVSKIEGNILLFISI
uniref:inositol-phosphate phosphatase n=1 Tax=Clastoptera arizonana TaxID=38151 RepID=A0A1B6CID9_9HEMI